MLITLKKTLIFLIISSYIYTYITFLKVAPLHSAVPPFPIYSKPKHVHICTKENIHAREKNVDNALGCRNPRQ